MPPTPDRIALVTGASSGFGKATAAALAAAGFLTYATARNPDRLAELRDLGCRTLPLDVTSEASMTAAVETITRDAGPVSLLVNNAGYGEIGPVEELDMAAVRREFETNVFGLVRMCQLVLPGMRATGAGRIVNIGSVGGLFTTPGSGAYHASKYAVESFSDALRCEVAPFGVEVVLLEPTGARTGFMGTMGGTMPETGPASPYAAFKANLDARTQALFAPSARGVLAPEDVARVVLRAATAQRPRARYKVGLVAHVLPKVRRSLPDRTWDALMRRQFPVS